MLWFQKIIIFIFCAFKVLQCIVELVILNRLPKFIFVWLYSCRHINVLLRSVILHRGAVGKSVVCYVISYLLGLVLRYFIKIDTNVFASNRRLRGLRG